MISCSQYASVLYFLLKTEAVSGFFIFVCLFSQTPGVDKRKLLSLLSINCLFPRPCDHPTALFPTASVLIL